MVPAHLSPPQGAEGAGHQGQTGHRRPDLATGRPHGPPGARPGAPSPGGTGGRAAWPPPL
eukprot:10330354-Alexandrium_andersonii.AAC.1